MVTTKRPQAAARPKATRRPKFVRARKPTTHFDEVPDPINEGKYPGDLEGDGIEELNQLHAALRKSRADELKAFQDATITDYYFVVYFDDADQCAAFLRGAGMLRVHNMFVDGRELADYLGIEIPETKVVKKHSFRAPHKKMLELAKRK